MTGRGRTRAAGRVGINAHLLASGPGYRRAGIHQYLSGVLAHLPRQDRLRYTVFTGPAADTTGLDALPMVASRWPTGRPLVRIMWEQVAWPLEARRRQLDLLHGAAFVTPWLAACPTVVTIYDLSFIHYPDHFPAWQRLYLATQTRRSCRQARRVIAISEAGRQDIHRQWGVPLARIDVVTPGVDPIFRPRPAAEVAAFRQAEGLERPFVLHVGTLQPRKNIPVLLEALARLGRPELALVLVGGKGWLYDEIFARVAALGLADRVRFAGYVADEALPLWYNAAALLVHPSLYEGYGMPVAQAMACGTPVVAAEASALPEAAGEAALFFPPHDTRALAECIASVLDDPQLAAKMGQCGLEQARQLSWARAGQLTAEVYRRALDEQ